ncbi:MAPEG family protein [Actibacterium ureilyticum]|uniref:MAPEG family protein n=1 Tax=Actibacterium ureilyticum TaxID=1590614 RepID=UPI000BAAAAF9|nr:MAPEG family protein [Actibacterium ureilyticum]
MLTATPLYAGLLGLLFMTLTFRVVMVRRTERVSLGDGGFPELEKRIRVQGNCAEYAPMGILLLGLAEMQGMPVWLVHVFGLLLLAGRLAHAWGLSQTPQVLRARIWGMYFTVGVIISLSLANIGHVLF